jgi:myo-inositol-1(or 4)-monophosphatase
MVNSIDKSSIAVVIHEKLKHREDITSTLLQNVLIQSGSMLTKNSYLFSCIEVASGQISGLIVLGVDYRHLCAGLLIVQNAGGKVTDENGDKFSSKSEICIVSNGLIHDDLLAIIAQQ